MKPWTATNGLVGPPMSTPDDAIAALHAEIDSPRWRNWKQSDEWIHVELMDRTLDYHSGGYWTASTTMVRKSA